MNYHYCIVIVLVVPLLGFMERNTFILHKKNNNNGIGR